MKKIILFFFISISFLSKAQDSSVPNCLKMVDILAKMPHHSVRTLLFITGDTIFTANEYNTKLLIMYGHFIKKRKNLGNADIVILFITPQ